MRLFITILLISSISFANNSLIDSKDINVVSERDEVINQDLTSTEKITASALNKKLDALNLRMDQFSPVFFYNFSTYYEAMSTNAAYSSSTPVIATIEKKYDSPDTFLQIETDYYLRPHGTSSGTACTLEIEVVGDNGSCSIYQSYYKNANLELSIKLSSLQGYCLDLNKGSYDVTFKKTRGNIGGAYYYGRCDFFHHTYGKQSFKIIEVKK